ncbi:MAG: sensor domain-containing diguanylate cyclase [Acidimicrobiia bacterium]|nr:sensor domain-containing diguanylate cyclase [Acidimicrobiia bacterium]
MGNENDRVSRGSRLDDTQLLVVLERLPEGIAVLDDTATIVYANQTLLDLSGWQRDEIVGRTVFDFVHPDDLAYMAWSFQSRAEDEGESGTIVAGRVRCADGSWLAIEANARSLLEDASLGGMILSARDVSRQAALADSPARLRSMIDRSSDVVLLVAADGTLAFANRRLTSMVGHDCDRVVGDDWTALFRADQRDEAAEHLARLVSKGSQATVRWRAQFTGPDGRLLDIELQAVNHIDDPVIEGVIVSARDVTDIVHLEAELRSQRDRLRHEVSHDGLTGLANRHAFLDLLQAELSAMVHKGGDVVVAFADLDRFKSVNDQYGHRIGDEVLRIAAARLAGVLRSGDVIARWGGDEMVLLLAGGPDERQAAEIARRLEHSLDEPMMVSNGASVAIGVSVGLERTSIEAGWEGSVATAADELIAAADVAMYERKRERRQS